MHHLMIMGQFGDARAREAPGLVAVVATLSRGYDLDYIWEGKLTAARPRTRPAPLCQDQVRHQGQPLLVELEG